jgi:hypothetical protein
VANDGITKKIYKKNLHYLVCFVHLSHIKFGVCLFYLLKCLIYFIKSPHFRLNHCIKKHQLPITIEDLTSFILNKLRFKRFRSSHEASGPLSVLSCMKWIIYFMIKFLLLLLLLILVPNWWTDCPRSSVNIPILFLISLDFYTFFPLVSWEIFITFYHFRSDPGKYSTVKLLCAHWYLIAH